MSVHVVIEFTPHSEIDTGSVESGVGSSRLPDVPMCIDSTTPVS
jgi:hypothetical protein